MTVIAGAQERVARKQKLIRLERMMIMPAAEVWKAWTNPEQFKKWWGPKNYTCPFASIDLQPGGKYLHCMRSPFGEKFWSTGTYNEIIPLKKLVFTDSFSDNKGNMIPASDLNLPGKWPMMLTIAVSLESMGDSTKMIIEHDGIPTEIAEQCITGWNEAFDKMESMDQS